jgi:UDP-N-acetylmuramoylalanine--D-glutamate ligase
MKVAILGYDTEGRVSYDYFVAQGHDVTICDQKTDVQIPPGATSVLGEGYLDDLDRFDSIVRTAGLPPRLILEKNPTVADKVTTQVNEFMRVCPTRNIIGVTGTKGKGTTSTLIAKMLEAAGKQVFLGGNIGIPVLSFVDQIQKDSWVVLELSSFQLSDLRISPHIAVCLMVVPEHLNWHTDMEDYANAKSHLFAHQKEDDVAIYFAENETSKRIAAAGSGQKLPYFAEPGAFVEDGDIVIDGATVAGVEELKLLGAHNWQNACAALTVVWQISQDIMAFRSVLTGFSGLPHRLERVQTIGGVQYYDDSFGTTPETAMVAIQAFTEPVIVILGGQTKGVPFDELADTVVSSQVKQVITIGDTGAEIANLLRTRGYDRISEAGYDIKKAVALAQQHAASGDVVLLSTGCASFDMFENYKDRAAQFIAAVQALAPAEQ